MSWQRSRETKRRYKKLHDDTIHCYGSGVWYDKEKGRYIRCYQPRRAKFVKRKCNRAVRRYKGSLSTKGSYRKISEYWWDIW
jgi:hypothetical protein